MIFILIKEPFSSHCLHCSQDQAKHLSKKKKKIQQILIVKVQKGHA